MLNKVETAKYVTYKAGPIFVIDMIDKLYTTHVATITTKMWHNTYKYIHYLNQNRFVYILVLKKIEDSSTQRMF